MRHLEREPGDPVAEQGVEVDRRDRQRDPFERGEERRRDPRGELARLRRRARRRDDPEAQDHAVDRPDQADHRAERADGGQVGRPVLHLHRHVVVGHLHRPLRVGQPEGSLRTPAASTRARNDGSTASR